MIVHKEDPRCNSESMQRGILSGQTFLFSGTTASGFGCCGLGDLMFRGECRCVRYESSHLIEPPPRLLFPNVTREDQLFLYLHNVPFVCSRLTEFTASLYLLVLYHLLMISSTTAFISDPSAFPLSSFIIIPTN